MPEFNRFSQSVMLIALFLSCFAQEIKSYEITSFNLFEKVFFVTQNNTQPVPREANNIGYVFLIGSPNVGLKMSFTSFNRTFNITAASGFTHLPVMDPEAVLVTGSGSRDTQNLKGDFFIGRHYGYPRCNVEGYLFKGLPKATISCPDETFVVEPAGLLFQSYVGFNAIVTKQSDIFKHKCGDGVPCFRVDTKPPNDTNSFQSESQPLKPQYLLHEYHQNSVCGVHVVADHTLAQYHHNNYYVIKQEMITWLRQADKFFSNTDFNGDGRPDNIRVIVRKMSILRSDSPGYGRLVDPDLTVDKTLESFSEWSLPPENGEFCLVIIYVHRDWMTTNGVAYQGKPLPGQGGGLCHLVRDPHARYYSARNNAVLMTNVVRGQIRPHINMAATTAHEVGHAFGAPHDNDENEYGPNPPCGYQERELQFLMNAYSGPMLTERNQLFSPCSIAQILPVIRNKGYCLEPERQPFCGDGIVQEGEECDCGETVQQCQLLDECCVSPAEDRRAACHVARHRGHECSLATHPCCDLACRIQRNPAVQCSFSMEECTGFSFCDGRHSSCPDPEPLPDGRPCQEGRFVCKGGVCGHQGCAGSHHHQLCRCGPPHECSVCCHQHGHPCLPAHTLGIPNVHQELFLGHGTQCGHNGFCDRWGNCRMGMSWGISDRLEVPPDESKLSSSDLWFVNYWYILVFALVLLLLVILVILGVRTHRKRVRAIQQFNQTVDAAHVTLKKQKGDEHLVGPYLTEVSRLSALFPGVATTELLRVCQKHKSEQNMVRDLLQKGYPMRTDFSPNLTGMPPAQQLSRDIDKTSPDTKIPPSRPSTKRTTRDSTSKRDQPLAGDTKRSYEMQPTRPPTASPGKEKRSQMKRDKNSPETSAQKPSTRTNKPQ